jgi:E3 ubiquitin-protein ligase SHPRH
VEEHFYRRQHIEVSRSMASSLRRYPPATKLSGLDRSSLATLLGPLLRLRQGCCHPQAVRGQFMNLQTKTTLTMEELLDQLIKKAANETEEAHRRYISALNGLAGRSAQNV